MLLGGTECGLLLSLWAEQAELCWVFTLASSESRLSFPWCTYRQWGIVQSHFLQGFSTVGVHDIWPWWETGQKGGKSQRIREFAVRLCLLVISEATLVKYHQHELNSDDTNRHPKVGRENLLRTFSYPKNYRQLRNEGNRRSGLSRGRAHDWLANVMSLVWQCQ